MVSFTVSRKMYYSHKTDMTSNIQLHDMLFQKGDKSSPRFTLLDENDHLNIGVMQTSNQDWKDRTKDTMWIASEILEPQYATL